MTMRILSALLAASALGCGSSETIVSGTVTVNDQPLQRGYITFFPVDSTKGARGTPVTDGRYALKKISPGRWKALISETPEVQRVQNADAPPTLAIAPSAAMISPQTSGNQPIVEIRAGKQTLDFALQNP